jgi:ankyrin repeat protein
MNKCSFLIRLSHSPILLFAIVTLITLASITPAFCGEIHEAPRGGNLVKVKALLKDNPNLVLSESKNGFTPLHYAVQYSHKDVAELLLANKAKVNARAEDGSTPLYLAVANGHKGIAELLCQHGGHE